MLQLSITLLRQLGSEFVAAPAGEGRRSVQSEKSTASREWGNENEEPPPPSSERCIRPSERGKREKKRNEGGETREREIKGTSEFKCTAHSNSVCLAAADTSRGLLTTTRWGLT